jgi:hypothetical protein
VVIIPHHRRQVGVVEHDPLRFAGGAARVDQQGECVAVGGRRAVQSGRCDGQRGGVDGGHPGHVDHGAFVDDDPGARVLDLECRLAGGQGGVDRRERGADPPSREHDHDQLDPIGE